MQIISSDPAPYNTPFSSDNSNTSPEQRVTARPDPDSTSPLRSDTAPPCARHEAEKTPQVPRGARNLEGTEARNKEAVAVTPAPKERGIQTPHHSLSRSFSGSVGYLSNRWNQTNSFTTPVSFGRDDSYKSVSPIHPGFLVTMPRTNRTTAPTPSRHHASNASLPARFCPRRALNRHPSFACPCRWKAKPRLSLRFHRPLLRLQYHQRPRCCNPSDLFADRVCNAATALPPQSLCRQSRSSPTLSQPPVPCLPALAEADRAIHTPGSFAAM